jgi:holin-like protein
MIAAMLVLLGCALAGEIVRALLHLPIPGPVIGMTLLAALLIARERGPSPGVEDALPPSGLDTVANQLIANLGLLFVPAGVGVIAEAQLLRAQWLPILGGLIGSTLLSLATTALVMHYAARCYDRRAPETPS